MSQVTSTILMALGAGALMWFITAPCPKGCQCAACKERFGAFSLRAAVRPPYNRCWGRGENCNPNPGLEGV